MQQAGSYEKLVMYPKTKEEISICIKHGTKLIKHLNTWLSINLETRINKLRKKYRKLN